MAHRAPGLAKKQLLALHFQRIRAELLGVELAHRFPKPEPAENRCLHLGHEMHLAPAFQGINTLGGRRYLVAVEICAGLELGEILNALKHRCEPNKRWMLTPRRLVVSMRRRCDCGRMSPTRWVAPDVWPFTWQSKQATP